MVTFSMKNPKIKGKKVLSPLSINKEELKEKALKSLRSSFEIEGIYFSDKQISEMVSKVAKV